MPFGESPATRRRGRGSRRRGFDDAGADGSGLDGAGAGDREPEGPPADPYEVARTIALKLLDRRDYTRGELAARLARREVTPEVAAAVLDRFEEVRLIDDQRYAERYAVQRQSARSLSRSAVRRELLGKGIDAELADEALEAIDDDTEQQTALDLARRKARPMVGLPRDKQYRRLAGALARKGYSAALVNATVGLVLGELANQAAGDVDPAPDADPDADGFEPL